MQIKCDSDCLRLISSAACTDQATYKQRDVWMQLVLLIYYIALTSKTKLNIFTYYYLKNICSFSWAQIYSDKVFVSGKSPFKTTTTLNVGYTVKNWNHFKSYVDKIWVYLVPRYISNREKDCWINICTDSERFIYKLIWIWYCVYKM